MANTTLTLLAAGSLRSAFLPLVAHFRQHTGLAVDAQFGPAGLLRERIEAGSPCAVFASANAAHPQALLQAGLAQECQGFASNQLMLTARRSPDNDGLDWLALLSTPRLRLATSTPGCDPSGDYTWQLFARIEARYPGLGNAMAGRAQQLVGGRDSLSVPPGEIAGAWLIRQNLADLFIGYAHYGPALATCDDLRTLTIPAPWNIRCDYQLARLRADPAALALYRFIPAPAEGTRRRHGGSGVPAGRTLAGDAFRSARRRSHPPATDPPAAEAAYGWPPVGRGWDHGW